MFYPYMNREHPFSMEEIEKNEKSRTLSDAELLKGGADYAIDNEGNKRLEATSEQMAEARKEMDMDIEAKKYYESKVNALGMLLSDIIQHSSADEIKEALKNVSEFSRIAEASLSEDADINSLQEEVANILKKYKNNGVDEDFFSLAEYRRLAGVGGAKIENEIGDFKREQAELKKESKEKEAVSDRERMEEANKPFYDALDMLKNEEVKNFIGREIKAGRTVEDIDKFFALKTAAGGIKTKIFHITEDAFKSGKEKGVEEDLVDMIDKAIEEYKETSGKQKEKTQADDEILEEINGLDENFQIENTLIVKPRKEDTEINNGNIQKSKDLKAGKEETETDFLNRQLLSDYLSFQDVDLEKETKEWILSQNLSSGNAKKYADSLMELAEKYNLENIKEKAGELVASTSDLLKKIGIKPSEFARSQTWAIWDMAKQQFYLSHPDKVDSKYSIEDPMSSKNKQLEISDRHLGWEVYAAYQSGNHSFLNKLKDRNIRAEIEDYLLKPSKDNGTLSSRDLAD